MNAYAQAQRVLPLGTSEQSPQHWRERSEAPTHERARRSAYSRNKRLKCPTLTASG